MSSRVLTVEIVGNAGQLERALGRAAAASKSFGSQMESVGQKMAGVGRTLTTHVTLPILAIAAASTKMALDFESSMQLIRTQGGATQTEVNKMSKAVLDLVAHQRSYGYSANDMAGALRDIEFEGFQGARALEILRAGAAGARLGNADLKTVMDALTGAMVAFHVPAAKAAQLMATLSATVGQGRMTIGDLSAAMSSKLMPAASALNITVSQMGAALDIFTSKNVPAAAAANNLTTAFIKMATPSKAAVAIAKEMGFSFDQVKATLQTGGLPDALGVLANAYQNMVRKVGQVNAGADLMAAFGGSRTGASVASLVESYSDYMRRLKNIQAQVDVGKFWREASAAMGLPANKIKSAVQSIGAAMIQLGQVLAPVVAGLAQFLAGLAARFDKLSPSTKRFIEIAAGIAAALGPTLMIVGRFTQAIGMLSNAMMFLATNPEMLLVAAFAAIAGAVVAAEYAPKQFTAILEKLGVSAGTAKRVIADLQEAFRVFRKIVEIAMKGLIPVLKDAFNTLKANFQLFADLLRGKWGNLWGDLKRVAVADFHQMADGVISTLKALLGLAERAAQAIGDGILHHILDPIKNLAVELWHWLENEISSAISTVVGWVKAKAEAIGHAITSGIMSGLGGLSNIAGGIFHTLGGGIMSGLGSVGSFLGIGSPSRWTHDHIGRPIGQGIVEGAKSGLANLGAALQGSINAAMRAGGAAVARNRLSFMQEWKQLTQAAVQSIRGGTPAVTAAMRNLENAAMTAFDAATQAGTQRIKQNLTRQLDQIQSILASRIAFVQSYYQQQINAVMAPSNALEKQIQQQQQAHDLAAAQYNLAQAKQQLQSDQAAGADQQTLDADQRAIDEAQYQLTQLQEQIQLENERAAAAQ